MHPHPARWVGPVIHDPRRAALALVAVFAVLGSVKVATSVVGASAAAVGAVATVGVLAAALSARTSLHDIGISRHTVRVGATWAAGLVAVITLGYGLVALAAQVVPVATAWVEGMTTSGGTSDPTATLRHALVTIPLGTVLIEEVAFRGAIPALFQRAGLRVTSAIIASAGVFALWHVPGALAVVASTPAGPGAVTVVAVTVVFTGLAGLLLGWLRHRTGSLLPPIAVHLATNSLGVALVWSLSLSS